MTELKRSLLYCTHFWTEDDAPQTKKALHQVTNIANLTWVHVHAILSEVYLIRILK